MRGAVAAVAALLLFGCPGNQPEDESHNAPPKTSTSVANPVALPENSTSLNPVAAPNKELPGSRIPAAATAVTKVQLTEYEIQMPETLTAGRQTLQITNAGKTTHNFAIEGNGVATKLSSDLMRGDSAPLTLNLMPGTYTVFCPVDGHRGKGMQRTLHVQ